MPFQIVRNDITCMEADAIVSPANSAPCAGSGTDVWIHKNAGPKLMKARRRFDTIPVGKAVLTNGYSLRASYVIHTVDPVWIDGHHDEAELLRDCYTQSLLLAKQHRCKSVAFPLISAGNNGFPRPLALQIAIQAISAFLMEHEMQVYLVVLHRDVFQLSNQLFDDVKSYIDDNYADISAPGEYLTFAFPCDSPLEDPRMCHKSASFSTPLPAAASIEYTAPSLNDLLAKTDAGFTETLLKLIDKSGKKDSEVYKKANISKQHFSKIRKNPDYKPTKTTAVAFAIALELDLFQTQDLIGRAGFALTNSSKFDVIIMYFIERKNYNLFDINAALFEFDQALLGA